jgi:bone morphogenetic protein 3/3B
LFDSFYRGNFRIHKRQLKKKENEGVVFDESKFDKSLLQLGSNADYVKKCAKKSILIDFMDMSFSEWILEPKSYQSNYCAGGCKFPANKVSFQRRNASPFNVSESI